MEPIVWLRTLNLELTPSMTLTLSRSNEARQDATLFVANSCRLDSGSI